MCRPIRSPSGPSGRSLSRISCRLKRVPPRNRKNRESRVKPKMISRCAISAPYCRADAARERVSRRPSSSWAAFGSLRLPTQQGEEERGENAFLAPRKRSSDIPVKRREGDRQYAGPGERWEKAVQDPQPDQNEGKGKHHPCDALRICQVLGLDTSEVRRRPGVAVHKASLI